MNKLISASSLALFKSTFPDWADNSSQVFKSIAFTNDGYLYTHGKIFQMSVYGTENPWGLSFDLNNQDLSVTVAGYTDSIKLPIINIQSDDLTIIPSNGIFNISHPNLFNNQINIGPTTSSDTSINIPYVTINNTGHIITADSKVATLNHVYQQADNTTNSNGYLLLGHSLLSGTNNVTAVSRYSNKLYANPVTGELYASSLYEGTTALANKYVALSHISVEASDIILGHVKLSDSVSSSANTSQGIAATPKAVLDSLNSAKTYANSLFASNDAMIFVGTVTGTGTIQTHNTSVLTQSITNGTTNISSLTYYSAGWVFKVISSGIISGIGTVESGDIIICQNDYNNSYNPSDWTIIQTNIDGAVTATSILNNNNIILGNGNKNIKYLANGTEGQYLIIDSGIPTWKTIGITMRTIKYNGLDFLSGSSATNLDLTAGSGIQLSGNSSTGVLTITSTGVQQIFGLNILNNTTLIGTYNPDIVESTLKFNGGLTASLINSEYVISHSNSITALTSQTLGKVTYDSNGHITGFTEVTSLPNPNALVIENNTGNIIDSYTGSIQKVIKFVDGNDISLTPTTLNNIITITPSIVQRYRPIAFKNIGDTNDTTVFNDSSNGTLVFIAGNNVTFSNSLGRLTINALNPWSSVTETPTTLSGYGIYDGWQGIRWADINVNNTTGYYGCMTTQSGLPGQWWHVINMNWDDNNVDFWNSQLALPTDGGNGVYYRSINGASIGTASWTKLLDESNYNSYSPTLTGVGASGTWGINITGNATTSGWLNANGGLGYGSNGLQYFNSSNLNINNLPNVNSAPDSDWWHIIRMNHGNANGYYADLAFPLNQQQSAPFLRITTAGNVRGWDKILTSRSYTEYGDPRYVLKSGDTMTGKLTINSTDELLLLNSSSGSGAYARTYIQGTSVSGFGYYNGCSFIGEESSGYYAKIGVRNSDRLPYYSPDNTNTLYTLWHSGNDGAGSGLDADLLDGYHESDFVRRTAPQGYLPYYDLQSIPKGLTQVGSIGWVDYQSHSNAGGMWLTFAGSQSLRTLMLLFRNYDGSTGPLVYTSIDGSDWQGGKALAFISDNVASATKLQTARTIFGKTFDGTNNVTGGAKFANICIETNNTGDDTGRGSEINNYIGPLYLQYDTPNHLIACMGGGNVGIGTASPSHKLHVNGTGRFNGILFSDSRIYAGWDSGALNSISCLGWFRSANSTGWLNQTFGGGIYMEDNTWVKVYGGKAFHADNTIRSGTDMTAPWIGINQTDGSGKGLSLYGGSYYGSTPTYGIMFAGTATYGTHGGVTSDWATYFTMDNTANRGWIFRNQTDGVNVFSINNSGNVKANGNFYATDNSYLVLHTGNYNSYSPTLTGGGASGNWNINAQHLLINGVTWASNWTWAGQGGQPTWLWGSNDGENMYIWNPAYFSVNYANSSGLLNTNYIGAGGQYNPQVYFSNTVGLKVAMTGIDSGYWNDTLWINGYAGADVPNMCALHFMRDGTPTMFISSQSNTATSYGNLYQIWTSYNFDPNNYIQKTGGTMTGNLTVSALYTNNGIHDNRYNSSAFLFATDGTVRPVASFVQTPVYGVPIRALFRAYVSYSGTTQNSFGVSYNYLSSSASLTRVDTGTYRLTFSGTRYVGGTFTGDGNFQIFCIGRNINGYDSNPCYIALSNPQNNSIDFICADDASRNDGAAFTIYINYLM